MLGGLRLPLNAFARETLTRLGIAPNQFNLNGWRIIVAMQVLWREVFEGNGPYTVDEFLYCYKPFGINQSLGFYQFSARGSDCRMIRSLPMSDRKWKKEFFFFLVLRLEIPLRLVGILSLHWLVTRVVSVLRVCNLFFLLV